MNNPNAVAVFAPTPLLTVTVERSAAGDEQLHIHLGGQGVWVARMIARLGLQVTLCTAYGGETGAVARDLLSDDGIEVRAVNTVAWTGGYVHDRRTGSRRELADVAPGPLLRHELDDLYSTTLAASVDAGICVLTGTHRYPVVPDAVYRRLAHDLHGNGVNVVADLSGVQLAAALDGGITLLKVSEEELIRDGWIDDAPTAIETALADLAARGADQVVISRGSVPCEALIDGVRYLVEIPVMEPVDHRGAGDAMTGVLAACVARGAPVEELLSMASAAGAATVVRHGYATGTRAAIESLASLVTVRAADVPPAR